MLTQLRPLLIFFGFLLAITAGWHLPDIHTKNNQRIFFEPDDPNLVTLNEFEASFGKVDNLIIAITGKNVFEKHFLLRLKNLTEESWRLPYVSRAQSLTNFQFTSATEEGILVRDLIPEPSKLTADQIQEIKGYVVREERIKGTLIGENHRTAGILLTFQLPRVHDSTEIPEVMTALDKMLDAFQVENPELLVHVSGTMATDYAFVQSSRKDLSTLVPACFLVMVTIVGLFCGGLRAAVATALCGFLSIVFTMGCAAWLGIPLSSATSIAPIVILILTVAHSVHILDRFIKETTNGGSDLLAAERSFRFNRYPILIATLTTAMGFLSFNFSKVPPFRDLGNLAAIGTIAAYYFSVIFLPSLLSYISVNSRRTMNLYRTILRHLGQALYKHRGKYAVALLLMMSILGFGATKNQLNDVILHYFDHSITYRSDTDYIVENLTGLYQIHYVLDSGRTGGVADPQFLNDVERFITWYRAHPKTISVSSLGSVIKRLNMNLHDDDPNWYKLPETAELAAQYLLLYEMSVPYGLDVNTELDIAKSKLRVTVAFETLSSRELVEINSTAENWVQKNASTIKNATGTGIALIFARISAINMKSMITGAILALASISIILIFVFRSTKIGLLSLVPNLIPLLIGFGIWGYLYEKIGLSLSVVSGMTLGIIVDDTVHFLTRYVEAKRINYTGIEALKYTYREIGQPLILTSIALVTGFMILTLSPFYLNASLGLLTALIIFAALLCDLLFLPIALLISDENSQA